MKAMGPGKMHDVKSLLDFGTKKPGTLHREGGRVAGHQLPRL